MKKGAIVLGILLAVAVATAGVMGWMYWKERGKSASADAALAEAETEMAAMAGSAQEMQAECAALTEENDALKADIGSAGEVNAALEAENTRLTGDVESLTARVAELETKLGDTAEMDRLTAERDSLASQAADLAGEIETLKTKVADAEGQIAALTEEAAQAKKLAADMEPYMPPLTLPTDAALLKVTVPEEISVKQDGVTAVIGFTNGNSSYSSVIVRLIVDGETVYESKPLLPGAILDGATLSAPLTKGEHEGDLCWYIYDDTGEYMGGGRAAVIVRVS